MKYPTEDIKQALKSHYEGILKKCLFEIFCFEQKFGQTFDVFKRRVLSLANTPIEEHEAFTTWKETIRKRDYYWDLFSAIEQDDPELEERIKEEDEQVWEDVLEMVFDNRQKQNEKMFSQNRFPDEEITD